MKKKRSEDLFIKQSQNNKMPPIRVRALRGINANERTPSPPRNREHVCPGAPLRPNRPPNQIVNAIIPFPINRFDN